MSRVKFALTISFFKNLLQLLAQFLPFLYVKKQNTKKDFLDEKILYFFLYFFKSYLFI